MESFECLQCGNEFRREIAFLSNDLDQAISAFDDMAAANEVLIAALEKLSRLVNEPRLGNSVGSAIAQRALKEVAYK